MSTLPGNPTALKTKVEGLITSANSIQSAIDDLNKFVTTSKSKAVAATQKEVQNAEKSLEAAHGRYKNTGLALREYQAVLADCHKRADAASAREESANRQRNDAQRTVSATKKRLQQLQSSHAPSVNVQNAQNAVQQAMSNERRAAKAATDASTEIAQIAQEVDEAAGRAISKIDTAMAATKDNWLDKISQFINKVGQVLADITKWVTKVLKKVIAEIVKVIAEVVKVLAIVLCIVAVLSLAVLLGIALAALITAAFPALLTILSGIAMVASCIWLVAKAQRLAMTIYNTALDVAERFKGPANVHYGDNGETTETVNTRPGREGLIRDKMDLAGRPHPRGDWKEPPGWHEVSPAELRSLGIDPKILEDKKTGFHATLFRDDNGRYVLSYEGTDFGHTGDVLNDVFGAVATSDQVHQAILAATTVKQRLMANGVTDGNFSLTGHSLGGELAAVGSIATGAKATTFNAAGVSFTSMVTATYAAKMNGFDTNPVNARARVENYHFSTDPLTNLQKYASLPEAYGKQIEVKASRDDWAHFNDINRGHGLDAMKRQYDAEHGHAYADRQKPSEKWDAPILLPEPERPTWAPGTVPTSI
jgi:extracellular phospholipase A1